MATQILVWWLVVQILGLLALPLTLFLFQTLPDKGYALSKSLGLLLTGYGAWLVAMLGLGSFGTPLLIIIALLIGGIGLLLESHSPNHQTQAPLATQRGFLLQYRRVWNFMRTNWPAVLAYEAVFLLAFIALAWIRTYQPDPWGTERPMDFALFNAIQRSPTFPPHDPWLAGYSINYYYFGYLLMAVVALLSGIQGAVAYNLSLALIFALTALGIASLVSNLIQLTKNAYQSTKKESQPQSTAQVSAFALRHLMMILGIVLVLFVGNQAGALQVLVGDHRVVALDGPQLLSAITQAMDNAPEIQLNSEVHTGDFSSFSTLESTNRLESFDWWWPSRALWDESTQDGNRRYNITEFPFFSFWLGDMHPHVMALPFNLLAMTLALATLARPILPAFATNRTSWYELILTGIVLGSLYVINSWDLPTYLLLYTGSLFLLMAQLGRLRTHWRQVGIQIALVFCTSFLLFLPFYLTFRAPVGFAEPLVDWPIISRLSQIIAPFVDSKSGLHAFLIILGLFLIPLIGFVYLVSNLRNIRKTGNIQDNPSMAGKSIRSLDIFLLVLPPILLSIGLVIGFPLLGLIGLGLLALYHAWPPQHSHPSTFTQYRSGPPPAETFVLLAVALGCAICFGTELIYIRDVFHSRMNTIFKFYYQVWLIWGSIAAYALWWIWWMWSNKQKIIHNSSETSPEANPAYSRKKAPSHTHTATALLVSLFFLGLLGGGLTYPLVNLYNLIDRSNAAGLAGKTPREHSQAGQTSIQWLREHAQPGSVILESIGGSYNGEGYGGISASTGLPTVLGWAGHQVQWRNGHATAKDELGPREADVNLIYSSIDPNEALTFLHKYNVTYIYVGDLERRDYAPESLAKFDTIASPVFQQDNVTIYQVPSAPE